MQLWYILVQLATHGETAIVHLHLSPNHCHSYWRYLELGATAIPPSLCPQRYIYCKFSLVSKYYQLV